MSIVGMGPKRTVWNVRALLEGREVVDYEILDNVDILKTIFSRKLSPERFNGLLSLILAFRNGASEEESEKAAVNRSECFLFQFQIYIH